MNKQEIIKRLTRIPQLGRALEQDVTDAINLLNDAERISVRDSIGQAPSPQNLWFNYETQTWID
jgi:hypothetical protein